MTDEQMEQKRLDDILIQDHERRLSERMGLVSTASMCQEYAGIIAEIRRQPNDGLNKEGLRNVEIVLRRAAKLLSERTGEREPVDMSKDPQVVTIPKALAPEPEPTDPKVRESGMRARQAAVARRVAPELESKQSNFLFKEFYEKNQKTLPFVALIINFMLQHASHTTGEFAFDIHPNVLRLDCFHCGVNVQVERRILEPFHSLDG